eukprot:2805774-Amphidinium_carterae.1
MEISHSPIRKKGYYGMWTHGMRILKNVITSACCEEWWQGGRARPHCLCSRWNKVQEGVVGFGLATVEYYTYLISAKCVPAI